jgi:hypothetical protein
LTLRFGWAGCFQAEADPRVNNSLLNQNQNERKTKNENKNKINYDIRNHLGVRVGGLQ